MLAPVMHEPAICPPDAKSGIAPRPDSDVSAGVGLCGLAGLIQFGAPPGIV